MIQSVSGYVDIPLVIGGGLRTAEQCAERVQAGGSFIVVGNAIEDNRGSARLSEIADAIHIEEKVRA
jgi:putative glycerol-1-phosphate prenyltransferase